MGQFGHTKKTLYKKYYPALFTIASIHRIRKSSTTKTLQQDAR